MERVRAALEKMGFEPVEVRESFIGFLRFEAVLGTCILPLDGSNPDIYEDDLVRNLSSNGVDLGEFWNAYDSLA